MNSVADIIKALKSGDKKALARAITIAENDLEGTEEILLALETLNLPPVIGVTGPPGAGKSTLINALVTVWKGKGEKVAVLAVDPTSPFSSGSLLGDRLRMSEHFNDETVFIRSLATRGALGGLSAKAIEITDIVRNAGFDRVIIETVGVGQSEVEIAGLADITLLVLVPEAGDDIQALKSGIMEIADIYVINKADRPGADLFMSNIHQLSQSATGANRPVIKTVAASGQGIEELTSAIQGVIEAGSSHTNKALLFTEKAWRLISNARMKDISRRELLEGIEAELKQGNFQLYRHCKKFNKG